MVARVAESRRFVEKLTAQYMHKQVLCVSHGFGVCYFLSAALGIPLEHSHKFASGNTALTIIEFLRRIGRWCVYLVIPATMNKRYG